MLLEWNGHVAARRGLGLIDKTAILGSFSPGPQCKEIIPGCTFITETFLIEDITKGIYLDCVSTLYLQVKIT